MNCSEESSIIKQMIGKSSSPQIVAALMAELTKQSNPPVVNI